MSAGKQLLIAVLAMPVVAFIGAVAAIGLHSLLSGHMLVIAFH